MSVFPLGQEVTITVLTYDSPDKIADNLADPDALTIDVLHPDGSTSTVAWPGGDVDRTSLGTFTYTFLPAGSGEWHLHPAATGAVTTSDDASFTVLDEYGLPVTAPATVIGASGLVSMHIYQMVTTDRTSGVSAVVEALNDALTLIEERLDRTLPHGEHTETLRVSSTGMVYPKGSPITAVSDPAVSATSIQGAGVLVGSVDLYPAVNWSDSLPAAVTLTYTGGYTIDGAGGTTKLPIKLRNAICRAAYNVLHATPLVGVPAGATSVHVGDAGFSGKTLRTLDPLDDGILRDIHGYRRQHVGS